MLSGKYQYNGIHDGRMWMLGWFETTFLLLRSEASPCFALERRKNVESNLRGPLLWNILKLKELRTLQEQSKAKQKSKKNQIINFHQNIGMFFKERERGGEEDSKRNEG